MEEHGNHTAGIKDLFGVIKRSPALMVTALVGVLLVVYLLVKYGPSSKQSSATTSTGDSSTVPTTQSQGSYYTPSDSSIEPHIYIGLPSTIGATLAGVGGTSPGATTTITMPGATPTTSVSPTATIPSNTYEAGIIRTRGSNPSVASYDAKTPGGVPVRSAPGGQQTGVDAYGTAIQITGPAVSGGSNLPGQTSGTNLWYPVNGGGYVSAFDVQSTYTGTGTIPSNIK